MMAGLLSQLWARIKEQTTRQRYLESSMRFMEGSGTLGSARPSFNHQSAVKEFNGWVFAAVSLNASAAASVPIRLYVRRTSSNRRRLFASRAVSARTREYIATKSSGLARQKAAEWRDDYEEVTSIHPVMQLLEAANPYQDGYSLSMLKWTYLQLTGNVYFHPVINPVTRVPEELWIMPSQWVSVIPAKRGSDQLIAGYSYGVDQASAKFFAVDEVGHLKLPNPNSLYYGLGRVEAGWQIIQQNKAAHEMDAALFANHARPDYAVIVKAGASKEAFQRMEDELNRKFKGPSNAGRWAKFGGDVQIVPLAWPPKDLGGRAEILEEVASVFGVPIAKLKANDPTYANAAQANVSWLRDTIYPYLKLDEQFLNSWLLPLFDIEDDAFLAYDNPVPEDKALDRDTRIQYVNAGILSRNEARSEIGYEQAEGGDEPTVSAGLVPLSRVGESPYSDPGMMQLGTTRVHTRSIARKTGSADDTPRDESERAIQRLKAGLKKAISSYRNGIVKGISAQVVDRLAMAIDRVPIADYTKIFNQSVAELAESIVPDMLTRAARVGLGKIGASESVWDVTAPEIARYLNNYVVDLARSISVKTEQLLTREIQTGITEGWTVQQFREHIESTPGWTTDGIANRSEMIARTESARAFAEGQIQSWSQVGGVVGKEWLAAPDCCEFCQEAAERFNASSPKLRDVPDGFRVGSVLTVGNQSYVIQHHDILGPPLHPNCRCDLLPILGE